ncbi:hypothetical protein DL771_001023 [Monosporascus sp. 5C6A]|nr:hypothetical protein DL771_001023 [Monosporascus sp. 5C6A]
MRGDLVEHGFVFLNGGISGQPGNGNAARAAAAGEDPDGGLYGYLGEITDVSQYQDLLGGLVAVVQSRGPFDGIVGLPEGDIVAAALLLKDARQPFANFKCGILFSAAPPLDPDDLRAGIVRYLDPVKDAVSSPLNKLWAKAGWRAPEHLHSALARLCDKCQVFLHDHGHQVPGQRDHQALTETLRAIPRTIKSAEG